MKSYPVIFRDYFHKPLFLGSHILSNLLTNQDDSWKVGACFFFRGSIVWDDSMEGPSRKESESNTRVSM